MADLVQTTKIIRTGQPLISRVLGVMICAVSLASTAWGGAASTPDSLEQARVKAREELQRRLEAARASSTTRRDKPEVVAYRDANGGIVLTNRPSSYRKRSGYSRYKLPPVPLLSSRKYSALSGMAPVELGVISTYVSQCAKRHGLDEALVYAVIKAESNFNPNAVSRTGAQGLMQLMPGTASDMGVTDPFDPAQNIRGGTQYLAYMMDLFKGDLALALAGYNAGPEAVKQYGGVPPFEETRTYIQRVSTWQQRIRADGVEAALKKGKTAPSKVAYAPPARESSTVISLDTNEQYVVHFQSGLTQNVDSVVEDGAYYYLKFQGQTRRIRKDRVKEVTKSS